MSYAQPPNGNRCCPCYFPFAAPPLLLTPAAAYTRSCLYALAAYALAAHTRYTHLATLTRRHRRFLKFFPTEPRLAERFADSAAFAELSMALLQSFFMLYRHSAEAACEGARELAAGAEAAGKEGMPVQQQLAERAVQQQKLITKLQQQQVQKMHQGVGGNRGGGGEGGGGDGGEDSSGGSSGGLAADAESGTAEAAHEDAAYQQRREQRRRLQRQVYQSNGQDADDIAAAAALGCVPPPAGAVREVRPGARPPR